MVMRRLEEIIVKYLLFKAITSEQMNMINVTEIAGKILSNRAMIFGKSCLSVNPASKGAMTDRRRLTKIPQMSTSRDDPASSQVIPGVRNGHKNVETVVRETE